MRWRTEADRQVKAADDERAGDAERQNAGNGNRLRNEHGTAVRPKPVAKIERKNHQAVHSAKKPYSDRDVDQVLISGSGFCARG